MLSTERPDLRIHALIVGATHYHEDLRLQTLPSVDDDVRRMTTLYQRLGADVVHDSDIGKAKFAQALARWAGKDRTEHDVLVCYFSGHGGRAENAHQLFLTDDGVKLSEIVDAVRDTAVRYALFILDCCFAEQAAAEANSLLQSYCWDGESKGRTYRVLSAAQAFERAAEGAFSEAFVAAVGNEAHGGPKSPYLNIDGIVEEVRDRLAPGQGVSLSPSTWAEACKALPNPRYRPMRRPAPSDGVFRARDAEHWSVLARSVDRAEDVGDYFTGREDVLRRLTEWLAAASTDHRVRIVTGAPGSGKSAILGHLVRFATEREADSSLAGVAVTARQKGVTELVAELCDWLAVRYPGTEAFLNALDELTSPVTIIVDALDEAAELGRIRDNLLIPLALHEHARLVVGGQPHAVAGLDVVDHVLVRVDEADGRTDLVSYVRRRLADTPGWVGHGAPGTAHGLAMAVGTRVGADFVAARLHVDRLVPRLPELAFDDVMRPDELLDTVIPNPFRLFADTVETMDPDRPRRARDLLLPLAMAEGNGLPWGDIWPKVASELSGEHYTSDDVRWIQRKAPTYIVEDLFEQQSVYRLRHDNFAGALLEAPGHDVAKSHQRIASALIKLTPEVTGGQAMAGGRDWLRADPYIRAHLPTHLRKSGMSADGRLLTDPRFLVAAAPHSLAPLASASGRRASDEDVNRVPAAIYRWAADDLAESPGHRAALLELGSRYFDRPKLAERLGELPVAQPWRVPWADWRTPSSHLPLGYHRSAVAKLMTISWQGLPVVLAVFADGMTRTWLAEDGTTLWPAAELFPSRSVNHLAFAVVDDKPHVVAATAAGLGVWDLVDNEPIADRLCADSKITAMTVADRDGTPVAIVGDNHGVVQIVSLTDGTEVCDSFQLTEAGLVTLRVLAPGDGGISEPVLLGVDYRGRLSAWLLGSIRPLWSISSPVVAKNSRMATVDGTSRFVLGTPEGTIDVWDVESRRRSRVIDVGSRGISAIATAGALAAVSGRDQLVRVYDLNTGQPAAEPLRGHTNKVSALAFTSVAGRPVLASGGHDRAVLLWRLPDHDGGHLTEARNPRQDGENAVVVAQADGHKWTVTGRRRGELAKWHATSGFRSPDRLPPAYGKVTALASVRDESGEPIVVAGDETGNLLAWRLSGEAVGGPMSGHTRTINALAAGILEDGSARRPVVISASDDGGVRLWDLLGGCELAREPAAHAGPVLSLAAGSQPTTFVTGGRDGVLKTWQVRRVKGEHVLCQAAKNPPRIGEPITALAVAQTDTASLVLFGTARGDIDVIGLGSPEPRRDAKGNRVRGTMRPPTLAGRGPVRAIAITTAPGDPTRPIAVIGSADGTIHLYDVTRPDWRAVPTRGAVTDLAAVPDEHAVMVAARQGILRFELLVWPWSTADSAPVVPVARTKRKASRRSKLKYRRRSLTRLAVMLKTHIAQRTAREEEPSAGATDGDSPR
ncbi:caspase family protein [Actinophytocola sediminis]